ncbi:MAG TPA: alpha/beta hydrolase [Polyangiaceae bacterium]|nr:alpha/beta hydrolase [Polyangiaceae bacterium]
MTTMLRMLRLFIVTWFETSFARLRGGRLLPSWNFQFEWVVRFLRRDFIETSLWPYGLLRRELDGRRYPSRALPKVAAQDSALGGVPVVIFTPKHAEPARTLLYFHGGSYIFGSARTTHADLLARIALGANLRVVAPNYRLAPEHPYPAALEDALAVFAELAQRTAPSEIVLMGDSAGGNLALVLQIALRDRARARGDAKAGADDHRQAQAKASILISPWLDLSASLPSCRKNDRYDYGQTEFLLRHARDFAGQVALDDARVSPLYADLGGLAPVVVLVGGAERLHDEAIAFVDRARSAGVRVALDVAPEMPHLAPALADFHPAAKRALETLIAHARDSS